MSRVKDIKIRCTIVKTYYVDQRHWEKQDICKDKARF